MTTSRLRRLLAAAPLALLLAAPTAAQREAAQLERDMEFARRLAERFQYIDLAERVISKLESERLGGKELEGLTLLKCDVYAAGAKGEPNAEKRIVLFDKAVSAYREFLRDNPTSDLLGQAQRAYIDLVNAYGRVLELQLDEVLGAEAQELREKIADVLQDGLDLAQDLIGELDPELSQVEKLAQYRLMLNRAQMLLTRANVSEDGTFFYGVAERTLEELALAAGETSGPGLNAYILLAKVKAAQGDFEDAAAFGEFVAETAMPSNPDDPNRAWKDQAFEIRATRFKLVELITPDLVESLLVTGDVELACQWALHFYNGWKREGFDLSPQGYLSLLACARAFLDSNGWVGGSTAQGNLRWFETEEAAKEAGYVGRNLRSALDLALATAQEVNDANRGNVLQLRAQKLIADIISRPGIAVSPEVLFEAAEGEYNAREYHSAITAYKNILRALDQQDEATQREYAPKVLHRIGSSFARLDRDLEAAMAFREAATTWSGDPEYQRRVADGYFRSMSTVRRKVGEDQVIERMYLEAEQLVEDAAKDTGGADEVRWRKAERAYAKKDYAEAREAYLQISSTYEDHEKALTKAALTLYKMNDLDGAREEFARYVDVFVQQPENAVTGLAKRNARDQAEAQAVFYLGLIGFKQGDVQAVLDRLQGYEERFPDQTSYGPNALYMVVRAQLAKNDLEGAKETQAKMMEVFADNRWTGTAARVIAQVLKAEVERLEKAGDADAAREARGDQARYANIDNTLDPKPAFANLRAESVLWLELGEWAKAQEVLERLVRVFGNDPERQDDLDKFVRPDLGWALLEQQRVPEAFAALDPLVPSDEDSPRKPASTTVRHWTRAVTGWVEGDGRSNVEVPGVGGAENLARAADYLLKLTNQQKVKTGGWDCPWYELKFELAYAYYRWGEEDSSRTQTANAIIEDLRNNFADPRLGPIEEACGDDVLRQRFLWLWDKVK